MTLTCSFCGRDYNADDDNDIYCGQECPGVASGALRGRPA